MGKFEKWCFSEELGRVFFDSDGHYVPINDGDKISMALAMVSQHNAAVDEADTMFNKAKLSIDPLKTEIAEKDAEISRLKERLATLNNDYVTLIFETKARIKQLTAQNQELLPTIMKMEEKLEHSRDIRRQLVTLAKSVKQFLADAGIED